MNMMGRSALLLMVLLATAMPALAGGVVEHNHEGVVGNVKIADGMIVDGMIVGYTNKNFLSGTDVMLYTAVSLQSELEGDPSARVADYHQNLDVIDDDDFNPYYVKTKSVVGQLSKREGQGFTGREVAISAYIIMPKTFDANIAANMDFSEEINPNAELITTFTYDGVTRTFSDVADDIEGEERLEILLYPYCPLLKDFDINYENPFIDLKEDNHFGYKGSFVMRAVQT